MIVPGSRYENAEHLFTQAHLYNQYGFPYLIDDSLNLKVAVVNRETTYMTSTLPGTPLPRQEYYAKEGETMQFLAFKFMSDPNRWHEIADANPSVWFPLDLSMGNYMFIPNPA
jgi:hypothetical protein